MRVARAARTARRRAPGLLVVAALAASLSGCASPSGDSASSEGATMSLAVTSDAFADGDTIPAEFTCRGAGEFPSISWSGDVADAAALAVVVDDPDAPNGTFTHLVMLDLPVATTSLGEPFPAEGTVALNSAGGAGWTPPCPPSGEHHYRFTVSALSAPTGLDATASPDEAAAAIADLQIATSVLTGLVAA